MALFYFFKQKEYRKFEYKPYFYDPEKEKFNDRINRIKNEMGIENDETSNKISYKTNRSINFRKNNNVVPAKPSKVKFVILIITLTLLFVIFYLISIYTSHSIKNV